MAEGTRVVWPVPRQVEFERFLVDPPAPDQVQIDTHWTLVSPGSERHWFSGQKGFPFPGAGFPFRPGYALAGVVVEAGPETPFAPGDRVFTPGPGYGCHASAITIDAGSVFPVPEDVELQDAVFFTLADTAIGAVRRARIELGQPCAIVGLGPVGLLAVMAARASGAAPIVATDLDPDRRALALACGADRAVEPKDLPADQFDTVIEFAGGTDAALSTAIRGVRTFGRVIAASRTPGPTTLDFVDGLLMKNAEFIHWHVLVRPPHDSRPGSWTVSDQWGAFVKLLRRGALHPQDLVSETVRPDELPEIYRRLLKVAAPPLAVLIDWREKDS